MSLLVISVVGRVEFSLCESPLLQGPLILLSKGVLVVKSSRSLFFVERVGERRGGGGCIP